MSPAFPVSGRLPIQSFQCVSYTAFRIWSGGRWYESAISLQKGVLVRVFPPTNYEPHAPGLHQNIRLPNERARLRAGGAHAHGAGLRDDGKRAGRGRGAAEYLLRAGHGGAEGDWQNGNDEPAAGGAPADGVRFPGVHGAKPRGGAGAGYRPCGPGGGDAKVSSRGGLCG